MLKKINFLFVTLFGIGKISKIPGSIASLVTTVFLFFLFHVVNISANIILVSIIVVFFISLWSVSIFIKALDNKDPNEVVIDEFIDPESYELEVSSPGLDRKLVKKEDFDRFIGKTIKIKLKEKLNDRKNFKGLLTDRRGDLVILEDDQVFEIPMNSIDICRIVPQFN